MKRAAKRARFDAIGGRAGISARIIEIARQIVEVDSYKRAVIGAGQIQLLAELCDADDYWSEKAHYGHETEARIANGERKCSFNSHGSINWDELVEVQHDKKETQE